MLVVQGGFVQFTHFVCYAYDSAIWSRIFKRIKSSRFHNVTWSSHLERWKKDQKYLSFTPHFFFIKIKRSKVFSVYSFTKFISLSVNFHRCEREKSKQPPPLLNRQRRRPPSFLALLLPSFSLSLSFFSLHFLLPFSFSSSSSCKAVVLSSAVASLPWALFLPSQAIF